MKAIAIDSFGGKEKLILTQLPKPQPLKDEILIRVAGAGVNPVDYKIREGYLKDMFPHRFPVVLGWDVSGTVVDKGNDVKNFNVGDKVMAYARKSEVSAGTYAEFVTVSGNAAAPVPDTIALSDAAAIPLAALTAWQALQDFAQIKKGMTVLVHAGAGGVGSYAIQFAKLAGAYVLTTASAHNHEYVKDLGADRVIDYKASNFRSSLSEKVDIVLDCVGGDVLTESFEVIKRGGVLVSIVGVPDEDLAKKFEIRTGWIFVEPNGIQLAEIADLIQARKLKLPKVKSLPLEEAAYAHEISESRHAIGKLVLTLH